MNRWISLEELGELAAEEAEFPPHNTSWIVAVFDLTTEDWAFVEELDSEASASALVAEIKALKRPDLGHVCWIGQRSKGDMITGNPDVPFWKHWPAARLQ